jgi:heme exporter protein D
MNIYWTSLSDFWAMGGYGFYVWMSFGAAALAIAIETALLMWKRHKAREEAIFEAMDGGDMRSGRDGSDGTDAGSGNGSE